MMNATTVIPCRYISEIGHGKNLRVHCVRYDIDLSGGGGGGGITFRHLMCIVYCSLELLLPHFQMGISVWQEFFLDTN